MNLATSTLLILIFLLPGFVYRRFYFSEEFSKENVKQTFFESFLFAFLPSLVLHSLWFYLIQIFGKNLDMVVIGNLVNGENCLTCYLNIQENSGSIILYNFSIAIAGALFGFLSKMIVRTYKWDRRYKQFRFQNAWHYLLKGEFFDFPRAAFDLMQDSPENIELVYIDVLVSTSEGTIIYDGILVDYELDKDSGLDTITLKQVQRRYLKNDAVSDETDAYYTMPGHILIFKYSEILNMNISFYKLQITSDDVQVVLVQ